MSSENGREMAIISMACRFPQADTPTEFWENLRQARNCIQQVPPDRWHIEDYYHPNPGTPGKSNSKWGGFLRDVRSFDAAFFNIPDDEAAFMDPQHRISLELAQETLESAGYAGERRNGCRIGVFVGISQNSYEEFTRPILFSSAPTSPNLVVDNLRSLAAGRIAHTFNLTGPSLSIDTACSSSLVALHYACLSMLAGECDLALVGGISLNLSVTPFVAFSSAGALSPSPRSYLFDERADGFVLGEGGGFVLLTPLQRAQREQDPILAVIKGSAVNSDGRSFGLMAPNPLGQQRVLADAYRAGGIDPDSISYIEAHGTGTRIGDAVEARSLSRFYPSREKDNSRYVGSVKTNIGHLLSAAGIASVIKVVLALNHRQIPPSLNHEQPRANLRLEHSGFVTNMKPVRWDGPAPRRAAINGFGFGGTNAHVILEEAPQRSKTQPEYHSSALWMISANSRKALRRTASDLSTHLQSLPWQEWPNAAYSASTARDVKSWRMALVGHESLTSRLESLANGRPAADCWMAQAGTGQPPKIAFVFTGTDGPSFGQQLYHEESLFRSLYDDVISQWNEVAGLPINALQAAATQIALAQLLIRWNVGPRAVLGLNQGELAAAYLSGRLPLARIPELLSTGAQNNERLSLALPAASTTKPSRIPWLSVTAGGWVKDSATSLKITAAGSSGPDFLTILQHLQEARINYLLTIGPADEMSDHFHQAGTRLASPFQVEALFSQSPATLHGLYCTVGRLWLAGLPVDRLAVEAKRATRRIPVPTYPFERKIHWVNTSFSPGPLLSSSGESDSAHRHWLHKVVWSEDQGQSALPAAASLGGRVLILSVDSLSGVQLARRLRTQGRAAEAVTLSALEEKLAESAYTDTLVYLELFEPEKEGTGEAGVWQLLRTARIIMHTPAAHRPQGIYVVTAGSQKTGLGQEKPRPERAMTTGFGLALNDELGIPTRVVDFGNELDRDDWLRIIGDELAMRSEPALIAWREGRRYRREISPLQLPGQQNGSAIRKAGVYLITGGAGAVGSAIARGMALNVAPTLILVGRKTLSEAPEREDLLSKLRWAGAIAEYMICDVTSKSQVESLMARVHATYGTLTGVVHAAGSIRPGRLASKTEEQFRESMAPKVRGVELLADAIERIGLRPEFFVAFSSIVSVLPGFAGGLGDYAAANAYLDAFVLAGPLADTMATTINWTIWSETGQGADTILLEHLSQMGLEGIGSEEAYHVFRNALQAGEQQVVVVNSAAAGMSDASPATRESLAHGSAPERRKKRVESSPADGQDVSVKLASPAANLDAIQELLVAMLAEELEKEPDEISLDRSFTALDLDSMAAIDLVRTLEQEGFGTLPATLFFEHNTIEKLARYLTQRTPELPRRQETVQDIAPGDSPRLHAANEETTYSLSSVQLAFYTNHHLRPDEVAYAFVRQTVQGVLDVERLQQAIDQLVVKHPMLRTTFGFSGERHQPQQTIHSAGTQGFGPRVEQIEAVGDLQALEDEIANRPFDINSGRVMRVVVAKSEEPGQWHLLLHLHHIAADGWSLSLLAQELWLHYFNLLGQDVLCPPPPRSDIGDYIRIVQESDGGPRREEYLAWWREALTRKSHFSLELPYDGSGEHAEASQRALSFSLDSALSNNLQRLAAQNELSLFHLLLAVYYRCLQEWTGQTDVVVGIAEARRDYSLPDIQRLVGCLADVFPLYMTLEADESILSLATRVRESWLQVHAKAHVSSVDLVRMLPSRRNDNDPQLLNPATFSFARFPITFPEEAPIKVVDILGRTATAVTRLALVCWEFDNRLHFSWNYPGYLFRRSTVSRFADDFVKTARKVVDESSVLQPPVQAEEAENSFLAQIEKQWREHPERIALTTANNQLSYGDLAQQVGYWTTRLAEAGIASGNVVAFVGEPGVEAVIALLAVMRRGATWLPIDPKNPSHRMQIQLDTAGARVVVYTSELAHLAGSLSTSADGLIQIEQVTHRVAVPPAQPIEQDAIAYIIFTSGSTGQPKGVPISYQALDRYLKWAVKTFAYGVNDVVVLVTSLAFDASLRQCLAPLMAGSAIRPIARENLHDPRRLLAILAAERITIWSSVPSLWLRLLAIMEQQAGAGRLPSLPDLRLIQLGGEALAAAPVHRWQAYYGDQVRFANLYGPTEATINATCYLLPARTESPDKSIPIGEALPGRILRVVDEEGQLCEPGVKGELLIGGSDLTQGYLHDDDLTTRKFVATEDGQRFFRTGDMVVALSNGTLVFAGRNDTQVKVRGYRIELEEIECVLAGHPQVSQAVVVLIDEQNGQRLVAFLEVAGDAPTVADLRIFMEQQLPETMIPHRFQVMNALPLMVNGKIDRIKLRNIAQSGQVGALETGAGARTMPVTKRELALAGIWQKLLGVPVVYREDDFFALGGDSLNVLEVLVALESQGLSVGSAADLYRHRSLADQARVCISLDAHSRERLPRRVQGPFPLSPAQTGFLMTRSLSPPLATTWSAYFWLEGDLDVALFNNALAQLVERHPMLRTVCLPMERPPLQKEVVPVPPLTARYEEFAPEIVADPHLLEQAISSRLKEENGYMFDLASWPLVNMRLCRLQADRHIWFVAADHFIGDAFSGWIFGTELLHIYDALAAGKASTLPAIEATFRDYVPLALERERKIDESTAAFWEQTFREPYEPPTDWYAENRTGSDGEEWLHEVWELAASQFVSLKAQAAARGQTAHDTLLALFYRRLAVLTGRADLVVGTAVAGRDYPLPDLMKIFGSFATLLPIRLNLDQSGDIEDQIRAVSDLFGQAQSFKRSPRQIARLANTEVPLTALTGLQFMFSFMDFEHLRQPKSDHLIIRWDLSQTELQPPRLGTDVVFTGRALDDRLRLTFAAGAHTMSHSQLEAFVAAFRDDLLTLLPASPTSAPRLAGMPKLDAALIAYLPPKTDVRSVMSELGIKADLEAIRAVLFPQGHPTLLETATSRLGRTATICIPWFADELDELESDVLVEAVIAAGRIAGRSGARSVSLAGMLPSKTRYGFALLETMEKRSPLEFTTGHSLTAVTVVKNIRHVIREVAYNPQALTIAFLGLGSVGSSVLQLYLSQEKHPRKIMLCDIASSQAHLEQLAEQMRTTLNYMGQVQVVPSQGETPADVYLADVIVGASSQPDILDVTRLNPGTVVVDDSFPNCFDRTAAIQRMNNVGDVLLVGAGLLDIGSIDRELMLPLGAPPSARRVLDYFPSVGSPGCQIEALLRAQHPELPQTIGLVTLEAARAYWQVAGELHLQAPQLHLGNYLPDPSLVQRLKNLREHEMS